jgi:hypothetical protein
MVRKQNKSNQIYDDDEVKGEPYNDASTVSWLSVHMMRRARQREEARRRAKTEN